MKMNMKQSSGFTLIELIVVIVILGIMAAIAGPKFVDLQTEARVSVMEGVEGAVRSTATLVYSKSLIEGEEANDDDCGDATCQVSVSNALITTKFGYPNAATLVSAMDLQGDVTAADAAGVTTFTFTGRANCEITYTEVGVAGNAPVIARNLAGC